MCLTCPTHERLHEFTKEGSISPTCPHESMGATCPTRDQLTSLVGCGGQAREKESVGKAMKKGPESERGMGNGDGDVCVCSLSDRIRIKRGRGKRDH